MADCEQCAALRAEIEKLREGFVVAGRLFAASRDALAEVNAENERLRAALEEIASGKYTNTILSTAVNRARAAITQENTNAES